MKKVLTTALVVLMVASTVFAGFSGEFNADYTADFAGKNYGFNNGSSLKMTFDKVLGSTTNEKDIYAKLAGEFALGDLEEDGNLAASLALTEASINGANWKVDLTQMAGLGNYAGGFVAREYAANKSAKQNLFDEVKTTNGVTAVYDGWTLGLGMSFVDSVAKVEGTKMVPDKLVVITADNCTKVLNASGVAYGPAYVGVQVQSYVKETKTAEVKGGKALAASFGMKEIALLEDSLKINASAAAYATSQKDMSFGFGAKVAYAKDAIKADAAFDMIIPVVNGDADFKADVAANFAYDFINAGVYYATDAAAIVKKTPVLVTENLLDVKVGADLKSFEVPLALNVVLKDLVNEPGRGIALDVTSEFMEGASVSANFGMTFKSKAWETGVNGSYDLKDIAKFSAGIGLKGADEVKEVSFNVAAENTTLIENAALKLSYASKNFLDKDKAAGALTASVGIKF